MKVLCSLRYSFRASLLFPSLHPNCVKHLRSRRSSPHVAFPQLLTCASASSRVCDTCFPAQRCGCDVFLSSLNCLTVKVGAYTVVFVVASLRLLGVTSGSGCSSRPVSQLVTYTCPLATCLFSSQDPLAHRCRAIMSRLWQLACRLLCRNCRATSSPISGKRFSPASSFSCKRFTSCLKSDLQRGLGVSSRLALRRSRR